MRPGLGPDRRPQLEVQLVPNLNLQSRQHAQLLLILRQQLIEVVEQHPSRAALLLTLQLLPEAFMDLVVGLLHTGVPALNFWAQTFPQLAALAVVFVQLHFGGGINKFERLNLHWALD